MLSKYHVLIVLNCSTAGLMAQCPKHQPDTAGVHAENYYQDRFELMYRGAAVNQFSDMHGKVKFGMWYFFSKEGSVEGSGHFEFDVKQGWWMYFDPRGHLRKLAYYRHGKAFCRIDLRNGKRKEKAFKELKSNAFGYRLADSQFW